MEERITAFIDILGFSQAVEKLSENALLNLISPLYLYEQSASENREMYDDYKLDVFAPEQATFFSDCLVISVEPKHVGQLIIRISQLAGSFMRYGFFLRGGVCFGKFLHEDNVVLGPALISAHKIESKEAVYPRIIVTDDVYDLCLKNCRIPVDKDTYEGLSSLEKVNENCKPLRRIKKDDDGLFYINPFPLSLVLHLWESVGVKSHDDLAPYLSKIINKALLEYKSSANIHKKYVWLAIKYNEQYKNSKGFKQIEV